MAQRDDHYVDLIRMTDPFPYNAGPKTGALVEAKYGKGRWIYIGLGLWRQLPAGTEGAYQLRRQPGALGPARAQVHVPLGAAASEGPQARGQHAVLGAPPVPPASAPQSTRRSR